MAVIDRFEVENEYKAKLNKLLDQIKMFESKCDNYCFKVQPYLKQFFKPASRLIGHRLELLRWLLTSIYGLEVEFELNNRIMQKYSWLEEEAEDVCVIVRELFDLKCLDAETYDTLMASRSEFVQNYQAVWDNRERSDLCFLQHWPRMSKYLSCFVPIGFAKLSDAKSNDAPQFDDLVTEFLAHISTFEDEANLRKTVDEFVDYAKKLNDFLNNQYELDFKPVKTHLDLVNSIYFDQIVCKNILIMKIN